MTHARIVSTSTAATGGAPALASARPSMEVTRREFSFRYRSAVHFVDVFPWYGPEHKSFAALPREDGEALERDLVDLLERNNTAAGTLVIPSEYLEVVVTRA